MARCSNGRSCSVRNLRILLDSGDKMIRYLLIVPAILLGAAVALYVWVLTQPNVFEEAAE